MPDCYTRFERKERAMPISNEKTFDLEGTYVALDAGHGATAVEVTAEFWAQLRAEKPGDAGAAAVAAGEWLVGSFEYPDSWTSWEVHPEGDEIVYVTAGEIDLLLELPDGVERVRVAAGRACVVPRGVWHTADVLAPGAALHITHGAGTSHKPRG